MSEERDEQKAFDSVLKYLKNKKDSPILFQNLLLDYEQFESGIFEDVNLDDVSEILQELFLDGWFSPDNTQRSGNWLRLTSYGRSQLELDYKPVFLDPVATIQEIEESIPNMDSIALDYFRESLWAIKKRLYLSATVTMGCASERSILLLIEAVLNYYSNDKTLISNFNKSNSIKKKFNLLIKTIKDKDLKNELLSKYQSDNDKIDEIRRLFVDIDTHLDQMFSIYRINRNDAGHPTGRKFNEDIVKATAAMFKNYCEIIYGLISHL